MSVVRLIFVNLVYKAIKTPEEIGQIPKLSGFFWQIFHFRF